MTSRLGQSGEDFVAQWLKQQGWSILHQRWRSRWGEIDLIGRSPEKLLVFIEVKTRSAGNWDQGGALAVNAAKQNKIIQTAQLFLACYPPLADLPCRFDVALVHAQKCPASLSLDESIPLIELGQRVQWAGNYFCLQDYIQGAFEV